MTTPLHIVSSAVITPLDTPDESTFAAILRGRRLVDRGVIAERMLAEGLSRSEPTDEVRGFVANADIDKSIRLAAIAGQRALSEAGWSAEVMSDPRTALYMGTSKGPTLTDFAALDLLRKGLPIPPALAEQVTLGPGAAGVLLGRLFHLGGIHHTSVAACSSGLHALHRAALAIAQGECDRALVLAADASVHPLFEASFANLGVLAKASADGHRHCVPFGMAGEGDATWQAAQGGVTRGGGFFLTEAAAALTLERVSQRPDPITLDATWIGADSTHLLAIDAQTQSLRHGLAEMAKRWGGEIAFIHAHATGTAHDAHELAALQAIFPSATLDPNAAAGPLVFSSKRHLGHTLGAAGLLSLILSLQCHRARRTLLNTPLPVPCRSLTISQGFGGHIAVAAISG